MMLFWALAGAMILVVLVLLLRPLVRPTQVSTDHPDRLRVSVYRDNLVELDSEYQRGLLSDQQFSSVKSELEKSLLGETSQASPDIKTKPVQVPGSRITAAITALLVIALVLSGYQLLGNPQILSLLRFNEDMVAAKEDSLLPLDEMVIDLARHLERNPQDANAWMLLVNADMSLGRYQEAADSANELYQLSGDDPNVLLAYVNALVMSNNGQFAGKPTELLDKLLAADPGNQTALFFSGMAAEQQGRYALANEYYTRILPSLQGNAEILATVNQLIARNRMLMGEDNGNKALAPAQKDMLPAQQQSISIEVSVTPELADRINPGDTLFVYARAPEGPPMPLAVVRRQAGELPLKVVLDDSMAMLPGHSLSAFESVTLQARVSRSGKAETAAGDLIGQVSGVVVAGVDSIKLVIDNVVP